MSFSPEWLALREPVDHASRNRDVASAVAAYFAGRTHVDVVDLGCGTGSNLRATFRHLPENQTWTLVDHDPALLAVAEQRIAEWAHATEISAGDLRFTKDGKCIRVRFRQADLAGGAAQLLDPAPDLVTASALFDLISESWINNFAADVAAARSAFYTVLSYNAADRFEPALPFDAAVIAAFSAHQRSDKGFGPASGPTSADALERAFRAVGYTVVDGDSPWVLTAPQARLTRQLLDGVASAVVEAGLAADAVESWNAQRQRLIFEPAARMVTGHTDTFAHPVI